MTYITGGNIQASDYNTFAIAAGGINEIFSDLYAGSVRNSGLYPVLANDPTTFGYGQTPALLPVSASSNITAAQWAELYTDIQACGQHQGTAVVPPLPGVTPGYTPPVGGSVTFPSATPPNNTIAAVTGLPGLINTLRTNRFNLDFVNGQGVVSSLLTSTTTSSWLASCIFNFQLNFGSWNNARYFFNSGGQVRIFGSYPTASTPVEHEFRDRLLNSINPLTMNWQNTTAAPVNFGQSPYPGSGFYNLSASPTWTTIYNRNLGGGYYTAGLVIVRARYAAAAGTNGLVDFQIELDDNDPTPNTKGPGITYNISVLRSVGAVTAPTVTVSPGSGFVYT